ncbi:hypothetical protein SAMN04490243_0669 [Robiginitalea myxolifaciens]|uniref:DUF4097 domain-containing protein n=1 Tax=Robiginitalea myxolifaciens TaxID=400055 RepID=A0A1I6FTY4_9FLAO|nr:DUF4097 family beta strand repeat-containing protein [Robiginitalea myxolifaciens]SFR33412.1 hypothetical protein SAMN04490243_0669 [Robiginitalea myxolifaciens]
MKRIIMITIVGLVIGMNPLLAQQQSELFEIALSRPSESGQLVLQQIEGSIRVSGYDGNTVKVKATFGSETDKKTGEPVKDGMRKIATTSGKVTGEESNNTVYIRNKGWNKIVDFDIQVPRNFSLKLKTVNNGEIEVSNLSGSFELSNVNGSISLSKVSGAVTADSINGDITVDFMGVDPNASMAFSSLNGHLDVTFPSRLNARVKARSDWGDVFTDFEIAIEESQTVTSSKQSDGSVKVEVSDWVIGAIGNGGPQYLFKTYNGNVYIRQASR